MQLIMDIQEFLVSDLVPETTMSVFMLDGFFTALAIHPVTVMPSTWMPFVWDMTGAGNQPDFTSKNASSKRLGPVVHLHEFSDTSIDGCAR
ncbi:MAG: YecA family protein [Chlorobaculum sp.]|nr:YecA family protein [Chlorobaculum sp.]